MVYQLTALYHHPDDVAAFEKHYTETHVPLTLALPGIRSLDVQRLGPGLDGSEPAYHQVVTLTFDSAEAVAQALATPAGETVLADIPNAAPNGVEILAGEVRSHL
ncbi:EthD family reductase [Microbacterium sp. No. 7]|uniref:EthD family reductase n=1 Tax=Microbacterium sp. No. 7 TaxID=1714373 RepID=UPI0006D12DC3|nr:EthD family reductase [Microbacterium sp. No. 7]ALJ21908.1 hypothetical protein AOA12_19195 [Microbacterium sp. No. 7]